MFGFLFITYINTFGLLQCYIYDKNVEKIWMFRV